MRARLLTLVLLAATSAAADDDLRFQVIVHPSNPATSVARRQVSDMFLKKLTRWPGGAHVEPVEPSKWSKTRAYFLSDVMDGKSALALEAFWQKRVFSGRDTPPLEKASEEEVVAFVRANPGAIGYVGAGVALTGVKVLRLQD
jgi:ABC-type phosphate transport system substrate-binding protein